MNCQSNKEHQVFRQMPGEHIFSRRCVLALLKLLGASTIHLSLLSSAQPFAYDLTQHGDIEANLVPRKPDVVRLFLVDVENIPYWYKYHNRISFEADYVTGKLRHKKVNCVTEGKTWAKEQIKDVHKNEPPTAEYEVNAPPQDLPDLGHVYRTFQSENS
ncbi:hypothetical protein GEMRC1_002494 [Eukaryota sp. GEM-RC1]